MSTTDCAADKALNNLQEEHLQAEDPERPSERAPKPLKGLFFGFAATVTVGLALASWYVGVRIVTAGEISQSNTGQPGTTVAVQPVDPSPPAAEPTAVATVQLPALYLQAAGLGPKKDAVFVRSLEAKGFRAQVQVLEDNDSRILVGPFDTRADMEQAQRKLEAGGVLAIETTY